MNSKGKQQKSKPKAEEKCVLCSSSDRDVLKYGKMYKYKHIYVHYYCLLLSSALVQKGKDKDGIFGFLIEDINKEARRGEKLRCSYCKAPGATIGCSVKTCKKSFHLPCGIKNNALNEFYKQYDSYCINHRERQKWESDLPKNDECPTCYTKVEFDEGIQVLATPCCHKLLHRNCIQKQALSAGAHHFKCPLCCNKDKFKATMMKFGVHVPVQDASWELENNAYGELYVRHNTCDREPCLCSKGRKHRELSGDWQLLICDTCGSKGSHWKCVGSDNWINEWLCDECKETLERKRSLTENNEDVNVEANQNESPGNTVFDEDDDIIEIISENDNSCGRLSDSNLSIQSRSNQSKSQSIDMDKSEEFDIKKVKRLKTMEDIEMKEIKMEDKAIQCCLVSAEQLVDMDPIEDLTAYSFRNSIITVNNYSDDSNKEVIDIDDSDDEIILLN